MIQIPLIQIPAPGISSSSQPPSTVAQMAQIHQSHVGLISTRQGANLEQEPWLLHAEQEEKEEQENEEEEEQEDEEEQVEQEEQELSHTHQQAADAQKQLRKKERMNVGTRGPMNDNTAAKNQTHRQDDGTPNPNQP